MAMTLRTDDELKEALQELAALEGVSQQEIIRRAVLERRARAGHRDRVDATATQLAQRWASVLERLGTV